MDHRTPLPPGYTLPFPGMACTIDRCIGRGSNAIVYEAGYPDALTANRSHHVLVKELFPFDIHGHIRRGADGGVCRDAEGETIWQTHRMSFERGNDVHLQMLALDPDRIGGNLNTFQLNNTLYTILDDSGSRSLERELAGKPASGLRKAAEWCARLLDCLESFHGQGFLHLDISLDNILLTGEGERERVMLIDYNSVHSLEEIRRREALYFSAKEGFTAPEVLTGMYGDISFHTDLFSVAAVFHAMLLGRPPTSFELNRKCPPDGRDSPLLRDAPSSVQEQVKKILWRGLCILPEKRYGSCTAMKKDIAELLNRVDGFGVSHAALWEAGRRSVRRLVKNNPSLAYLEKEAELYPLRVTAEEHGSPVLLEDFMREACGSHGAPVFIEGIGGGGKSTALLRTVLAAPPAYSARNPAVMYLPLYEWKEEDGHFIIDRILRELRFDSHTRTMEDARHILTEQLGTPAVLRGENRPVMWLLLDGLNEAAGDTAGLLREISALSELAGLSVVVTGRVRPEGIPIRPARLDLLTEQDVDRALERRGLLMPESGEMRELLKTPLMLSLFIQTARERDRQVQCETAEQLIDAYLAAMCDKAGQEGQRQQYQAEAAVRLVLPAVARETRKQNAAPDDKSLLDPVLRCRKIMDTRTLARAFPQWVGHSGEIAGDDGGDAWYGQIVHDILWKKLGLLTRGETGGYHIRHQILQDYLVQMDAENRKAIRRAKARTGVICAGVLACLACVFFLCWEIWLKPRPYDETVSETVMDAALAQYTYAGLQYEAMSSLLAGKTGAESCLAEIAWYGNPVEKTVRAAIGAMQSSGGTVIPWSGKPFDFEKCGELLELPAKRAEEYLPYIRAYGRLVAEGREEEREAFAAALKELAEADADLAWLLDRAVSYPHQDGMPEEYQKVYRIGLQALPYAQENRSPDLSRGIDYAIQKAGERSREARRTLARFPVMYEEETK